MVRHSKSVNPDEVVTAMGSLLIDLESSGGVRHAAVGACDLSGEWSWSDAAGRADTTGRAMTRGTPWFLASVTKLFIAVVVLRLAERGELDLRAPIDTLLPGDLADGLHVYRGEDHTDRLTPVHLLGHFSGLPDWLDEPTSSGRSWIDDLVAGEDRAWSLEQAIRHARDELRPHFRPSDPDERKPRVRYSDTNFQILMLIAEQVTGSAVEKLFAEYITGPLGLDQTGLFDDFPIEGERAPASPWYGRRSLRSFPLGLQSIRDLFGTTEDLLSFGRALFSAEIFESPESLDLMRSRFRRFGFPRGVAGFRAPSWPIEYGLGMMRFKVSRPLAAGRKIPTLTGHTGSTGSWLWHLPELGLICAGTVDQSDQAALPFRQVPRALSRLGG